ncbi:response regulator [Clostridium diolis]|uniref:response regulator n=1 Tax=Clostridium diolis TaxID=223919 RepID=UPI003AF5FC0D
MCNIIIVDDEMLVRLGIKSYIENSSKDFYVVETFSNGKDALEYCKLNKPDIVLTDITMPIMDGLQLIEELRNTYNDIKIVVLSCHDDYKFIKGAFKLGVEDYVLKYEIEECELIKILIKIKDESLNSNASNSEINRDEIKKNIFNEIMNLHDGELISNELSDKVLKYCKRLCSHNLVALFIGIDDEYDENFINIERNFDYSSALSVIEEIFKRYGMGEIFSNDNNSFVGLISLEKELSEKVIYEKIYYLMDNINNSFKEYFNNSISVGISKIYNSLNNSNKACSQAKEAFLYRFYKGRESIIQYDENIKFKHHIDNSYIKKIKDHIVDKSNLNFNKEGLYSSIVEYFDYMKNNKINPTIFKQEVNNILYSINTYLLDYYDVRVGQNMYIDNSFNPYALIEKINYEEIIKEYITFFIERIEKEINVVYQQILLISKIKKYIDDNYSEELSLQLVADKFHLNKNYFCQYFKKETNKNFVDYLTEVRIEKAKKLLKLENLSSSEVAGKVGFNNVNYFVRVFKKVTGVSVTEYKKY